MPTAMRPHRLTSIRLTAGLAASIALLSTVLAPASSAAQIQADEQAMALSLVVAQNYYGQGMPLPKSSSAWWSIHFGAKVKVTGVKPGESVEARYIQPGSGSESGFSERRVEDDGTIVNLADMQPQKDDSHCSSKPVRFVLEMNQGWFAKRQIKPGFKLGGTVFSKRPG